MYGWRVGWLALVIPLLGVSCVEDRGRLPVARLSIEPRYVPAGQESEILLDGRRSCDEIEAPDTCDKSADGLMGPPEECPGGVTFKWSLDHAFERVPGEGSLETAWVRVKLTPNRPVTVTLKVTDCDNNTVTAKTQIGIELPYPDATPLDE